MSDDAMELDPHGDLVVRHAVEDEVATVVVSGEIDSHSAPRLEEALAELVDGGARQLVLDVGGVGFIDSSGLRVLIATRKRLGEDSEALVLRHPTPGTLRLLEMTGLTEQFSLA
jgi:anti-anti-sigma factor